MKSLALAAESRQVPGREIVRAHWRSQWGQTGRHRPISSTLEDGPARRRDREGTAAEAVKCVSLGDDWQQHLQGAGDCTTAADGEGELELVLIARPVDLRRAVCQQRLAAGTAQAVTQLTWGNAAMVSPATAERLGLTIGSYAHGGEHGGYHMPVVELQLGDGKVKAPVWIMPGPADGTVTVYLGDRAATRGPRRRHAPASTVGFDAYRLRTSRTSLVRRRVESGDDRTAPNWWPARSSITRWQSARRSARHAGCIIANMPEFRRRRKQARALEKISRRAPNHPLTFTEPYDYGPPKHNWGMAIDLTRCIGCNACVVACQAENNIPVVGKEQVAAGREMHWLRVDRYISGPADQPDSVSFSAAAVHALRKRAVRIRLSGRSHGAQRRRA